MAARMVSSRRTRPTGSASMNPIDRASPMQARTQLARRMSDMHGNWDSHIGPRLWKRRNVGTYIPSTSISWDGEDSHKARTLT